MKGQITLFIIVGLVILLIVGVSYYYRDNLLATFKGQDISELLEEREIKEYVEGCVNEISMEALTIVGMQGGYILVPIDSGVNEINNVLILGEINIPYWFYDRENNVQKSNVPELDDIEQELGSYISLNLPRCLNFNLFEGYSVNLGDSKVDVRIMSDVVRVDVDLPVKVNTGKTSFGFDAFSVDVDVPLGELYNVAREIMAKEDNEHILEERTFDMMVVYDEVPVSGTNFDCGIKIWDKDNVESDLKRIITQNIPYIKIKGTDHGEVDRYMEWDLLYSNYDDLHVTLMYLENWPFYFDVFPHKAGIMRSDNVVSGNNFNELLMGLFCMNTYNFVYDIKYPILFILEKNGYTFQFALETIIDNNQAREHNYTPLEVDDVNERCDIRDKEIEVYARDDLGNALSGSVYYRCGSFNCYIDEIINGYLKTSFPSCYNGEVSVYNEDYTSGKREFSSNSEKRVDVLLRPLYEKPYDVKLINKRTGVISEVDDEDVVIQLETGDYSTFIADESGTVKLTDGNYKVVAYVFDESGVTFTVEEKEFEKCVDVPKGFWGVLGVTKEECIKTSIPKTEIKQTLIGGNTFNWGVEREDLARSRGITFYIVVDKKPRKVDDISEVYTNLEDNDLSRFFKYPELK